MFTRTIHEFDLDLTEISILEAFGIQFVSWTAEETYSVSGWDTPVYTVDGFEASDLEFHTKDGKLVDLGSTEDELHENQEVIEVCATILAEVEVECEEHDPGDGDCEPDPDDDYDDTPDNYEGGDY